MPNPVSRTVQNWRDHPIQQGATTLLGMLGGPLASLAARGLFGVYNRGQDAATANGVMAGTIGRGNQAEAGAWAGLPSGTEMGYTNSWGETSPMTGFSPQWPGQGLPMARAPWSSQPGIQGGWLAPGGLLDMLGQSQAPQTPDGTGVSLPVGQSGGGGGGSRGDGNGAGWSGMFGGGDVGGSAMIRGVDPRYRSVYNGRRYGNAG